MINPNTIPPILPRSDEPPESPKRRRWILGMLGGCACLCVLLVLLVVGIANVAYDSTYTGSVSQVAFSPDGTKAVVVGAIFFAPNTHIESYHSRFCTLWEWNKELKIHLSPPLEIGSVCFSPDSSKLAVLHSSNNNVALYDTLTGKLLWNNTKISGVRNVVFSKDGKTMSICDTEGKRIRILDTNTGNIQHESPSWGSDKILLPNGEHYVLMDKSLRSTLRIFENATDTKIREYSFGENEFASYHFPPEKTYCATDGSKLFMQTSVNPYLANYLAFSVNDMKAIGRFSFSTQNEIIGGIRGITPDSQKLLIGSGTKISVVDASTGKSLIVFDKHTTPVWSAAVSPDGKSVLSGGQGSIWLSSKSTWDSNLYYWDIETGQIKKTFKLNRDKLFME